MGTRRETATAIGANVFQNAVHTIFTECTFERTDHCVGRFGWQTFIAMFTGWPQLKHGEDLFPFFYGEECNVDPRRRFSLISTRKRRKLIRVSLIQILDKGVPARVLMPFVLRPGGDLFRTILSIKSSNDRQSHVDSGRNA